MIAPVLALVLAQSSSASVVVVESRRDPVSPAVSIDVRRRLANALGVEGLRLSIDPDDVDGRLGSLGKPRAASCNGDRACLAALGRALEAFAVVGVEVADVRRTRAVHIEAIASSDGSLLAEGDVVFKPANSEVALKSAFAELARKLHVQMPPPSDAPTAAATPALPPTPAVSEPPPVVVAPPAPAPKTHAPMWAAAGVGAASLGAAAIFGGLAVSDKSQLGGTPGPNGGTVYGVSYSQATSLRNGANTDATLALSFGIGAVVLGAFAAYLAASN